MNVKRQNCTKESICPKFCFKVLSVGIYPLKAPNRPLLLPNSTINLSELSELLPLLLRESLYERNMFLPQLLTLVHVARVDQVCEVLLGVLVPTVELTRFLSKRLPNNTVNYTILSSKWD